MDDEKLEKLMHMMRSKAQEYAKAKSEMIYLDHFRKSKLSLLMKKAMIDGHETSASQDREARASKEYQELLQGLREATEVTLKLEWDLFLMRTRIDLYRTKRADERVEKRGYGL